MINFALQWVWWERHFDRGLGLKMTQQINRGCEVDLGKDETKSRLSKRLYILKETGPWVYSKW